MRLGAAIVVLLSFTRAFADARQEQAARDAFAAGKAAYEGADYQTAYDKFKESFQLSHEPALLYNIASALQGLRRPHEAAEALRSFLRLQPNDGDRVKIEQRIATLEEEQRMIDLERNKQQAAEEEERRKNAPITPPAPMPEVRTVIIQQPALGPTAAERRHRTRVLAVSLTIGAVVLAGGAITLGILLSQNKTEPFTMTSLGPHPGTR